VKTLTPRCYVCGKKLEARFTLAAMSNGTDRVFTVHTLCSKQMESSVLVREVRAMK